MTDAQMSDQVPVPELAISYRVRRRLKAEGKNLRRCADGSPKVDLLGRWFVVDNTTNDVIERDVDLESLARKLGAMRPTESIVR